MYMRDLMIITLASLVSYTQSNNIFPWVEGRNWAIPGGPVVKNLLANAGGCEFDPWSRKIPQASGQLGKSTAREIHTPESHVPQRENRHNEKAEHHTRRAAITRCG